MTGIRLTRAEAAPVRVETTPGPLQARTITRTAEGAHLALVAGGAMLIGGDCLDLEIHVGAHCTLDLEDVGGLVAYPGPPSRVDVRIVLEEGASLIWRTHPFVVASGAVVDRDTAATLAPGSALLLRETLVLGRTGERGGRIRQRLHARWSDGTPVHLEDLDLDGERPAAGVLGAHRVLDSAVLLGRRPSEVPGHVLLHLDQPGAIARSLADRAHASGLDPLAARWAAELLGPEAPLG
ncbi:urease accessory protein UreD [Brachybacterium sp. YJGR34]|uniref:urease accessory protein UreD n=1 Tax=Brachybacterium sp. YJGR34 TaxID=2059911 RepID=UPI000E0AA62D|nr:urease accessory protein UreD [Brachybacterium sp. YJGR34]